MGRDRFLQFGIGTRHEIGTRVVQVGTGLNWDTNRTGLNCPSPPCERGEISHQSEAMAATGPGRDTNVGTVLGHQDGTRAPHGLSRPAGARGTLMGAWDPRPALRSDLGYRISPFQGLGQDANAGHWVVRVGTLLKRDTDIGTGHERTGTAGTRIRPQLRSPPVQSNESGRNLWEATTYGGQLSGPDTFAERGNRRWDGTRTLGRDKLFHREKPGEIGPLTPTLGLLKKDQSCAFDGDSCGKACEA